jgi:hypothetical protein
MQDLDNVKRGDFEGLRRNEASRWVANDIISKGGPISQSVDLTRVKLDPSVKNKLVSDMAKINHLKEEQDKMMREALPEMDEIDSIIKNWTKGGPGQK